MSEVLYRKWRPQSFAEVAGQDAVTRTLRNSVASGRLAHAYLLCGPRGTGKTSLGRLLAKAANCAAPVEGEPCNACESCVAFIAGRAMDFVEQDAASHNSVDDIRQLRENVVLTPMAGGRKVYLLDEVHMLSTAAENALLKTLEEPPPHVVFVLATTEAHKVSTTIISRCQRFDLKRIPMTAVIERLAFICDREGFTFDPESLEEIARAATGSLRDAINALEQVVMFYGRAPSLEQAREALGLSVDARSGQLARQALAGDLTGGLTLIARVRDDGVDIRQFTKQVVQYLRGLLLAKAGATGALDLPREMAEEVRKEAAQVSREEILRSLQTIGRVDFRDDPQSSLPLELALVELANEVGPPAAGPATTQRREVQSSVPPTKVETVETTVATTTVIAHDSDEPALEDDEARPQAATGSVVAQELAQAAPQATSASAGPSDDLLERVRVGLKDSDKQLSALLNGSCEVKSAAGDTVVLGFYHTFHLERIESGSFRAPLERAFSAELRRQVSVTYEHAPRERQANDGARKGGHLVQVARELGARTVAPEE